MTQNVFTYGTLMLPEVVKALTGQILTPKPAILHGYSRHSFKGKCYPGIIENSHEDVAGAIYLNVDDRTLTIFDWFEDVLYQRQLLTVQLGDERVQAYTYVVPEKHLAKLDKDVWALQAFIDKHSENYIKKCAGYRQEWEMQNQEK